MRVAFLLLSVLVIAALAVVLWIRFAPSDPVAPIGGVIARAERMRRIRRACAEGPRNPRLAAISLVGASPGRSRSIGGARNQKARRSVAAETAAPVAPSVPVMVAICLFQVTAEASVT